MIIGKEKAKLLASVWADASSLRDAVGKAGLSNKDERNNRRYRRETEQILGITLRPHNARFSSYKKVECSSSLDLKAARQSKSFVITSCTNNSPIVPQFFEALKKFSKHYSAELVVKPVLYQDRLAFPKAEDYEWDEAIFPYALNEDLLIGKDLMVSSLNITPTAASPLSGLHDFTGMRSGIFGHPQLAMQSIASPKSELPKFLWTTGSINRPRYSDTKAGGKAKHHHTMSALFVQLHRGKFYAIQLMWKKGQFHFLDEVWDEGGLRGKSTAPALVLKDAHAAHEDTKITGATERIMQRLDPDILVWHDVYDHYAQSHHHDIVTRIQVAEAGRADVEKEVALTADLMRRVGAERMNYIVDSNHHDHLGRWVNEYKEAKDPHNARYRAKLLLCMLESGDSALECAFRDAGLSDEDCEFIDPNQPKLIHGIDVSQHGHRAANGSRGSPAAISKTRYKSIIGHIHSACIEKGCWAGGVWNTNLDYAVGLSSWSSTDTVIYENGARAHIYYINNKSIADVLD
jgi:hypothetical protein